MIIDLDIYGEGQTEKMLFFDIDLPIINGLNFYRNSDIKTIVTKEQFEAMEYKVEE